MLRLTLILNLVVVLRMRVLAFLMLLAGASAFGTWEIILLLEKTFVLRSFLVQFHRRLQLTTTDLLRRAVSVINNKSFVDIMV